MNIRFVRSTLVTLVSLLLLLTVSQPAVASLSPIEGGGYTFGGAGAYEAFRAFTALPNATFTNPTAYVLSMVGLASTNDLSEGPYIKVHANRSCLFSPCSDPANQIRHATMAWRDINGNEFSESLGGNELFEGQTYRLWVQHWGSNLWGGFYCTAAGCTQLGELKDLGFPVYPT